MPKLKTNSGAKKRVRVTASGKLKRRKAFKSHIAKSKSPKRTRQLRLPSIVSPANADAYAKLLPYG